MAVDDPVWLVDLGTMEYEKAWHLQKKTAQAIWSEGGPEVLYLVEHPPVYTIGRAAHGQQQNVLWDEVKRRAAGIQLFEVDRGGDATYHGPGQLVAYPILDLGHRDQRDLHRYLRGLEEAVIDTLAEWSIAARRLPPHTGVWVGEEKVAAIGVKASHWVTQHGLALNLDPNLDHFTGIIPCGIRDLGVTAMAKLVQSPPSMEAVKGRLAYHLAEVLDLDLMAGGLADLERAWAAPPTQAVISRGGRRG